MRDLLSMIYEYQRLSGKERNLDIELDASERVRQMGLARLLEGEQPDERNRRFARVSLAMPVQFTRPGGFEAGEIRNLGGGGFCIATPRPPEVDTRLVVRVEDTSDAVEYVFPCRVVWRSSFGPGRMGVVVDGVPHRSELFSDESTGVWRRSVQFGAQLVAARREPLVA